jgi:putative spermidine/putrescine transport system substrate-binding protein
MKSHDTPNSPYDHHPRLDDALDTVSLTRSDLLRRGVVAGAGLAVAAPWLLGAGDGIADAGKSKETFTFVSWGGAYQDAQTKAWINPYMKANPGVKIIQDQPSDYAKIKAMVESGKVTWDIIDVGADFGLASQAKILQPMDCSILPCTEMTPAFRGFKYRIANTISGIVLAYRKDKMPSGRVPKSWADFFDLNTFPGKRGLWKYPFETLDVAAVAAGASPKKLYPLPVDRAFAKLDTIKQDIVWWESGAQQAQLLADGEVVMAMAWNGRVYDIQKAGAPVAIQWNQHFQTSDYFVIPKGSKHIAAAMKFAAFCVSARHNAALSHYISYAPPNAKAISRVDRSKRKALPTTYSKLAIYYNDRWWDKNLVEVNKRFQEWVQK